MEMLGDELNRLELNRNHFLKGKTEMSKAKVKPVEVQEVKELALRNIKDVLDGTKEFDKQTQLSMKYLNYESRNEHIKQTETKLKFSMVKSLGSPDFMKAYIRATEPTIQKLLVAS